MVTFDLIKDLKIMNDAYNDEIIDMFILNNMVRLNREFDGNVKIK